MMLLTQNMLRETCQTTSDNVYDAAYIEYVEGNLLDYLRQCTMMLLIEYDAAYIEYVEGNLLDYLRQCI